MPQPIPKDHYAGRNAIGPWFIFPPLSSPVVCLPAGDRCRADRQRPDRLDCDLCRTRPRYDYALDMAVTPTDFIYPAGFSFDAASDDAYLTLKYDVGGTLLWEKRLTSNGNDEDKVNAVAVDGSDNVCVTGFMTAIGGDKNIVTVKYSPAGALEWMRTFAGASGLDDEGLDIGTDDAGNVLVTGYSRDASTGYDYVTLKYNSAGTLQWSDIYSGLVNWEDKARAIAVAGDGIAWVTGGSQGLGTGQDYLTIQYDAGGSRTWTKRYGRGGAMTSATVCSNSMVKGM